ncbi:MAG: shikimate kinase [Bacteroidota bacterium]
MPTASLPSLIFLWGFMGSGKTSLGKKVANRLGYTFQDLDHLIEEKEEKTVQEVFDDSGEGYFRLVERDVLHQTLEMKGGPFLISTGGGTPCYYDNASWMNAHGLTVYLRQKTGILVSRLTGQGGRPLIKRMPAEERADRIHEMITQREPFYLQAQRIVGPEKVSVGEILDKIEG